MTERQSRHLKKIFLEKFRRHGNVSWAAREAGLPYRTLVYDWQEHDDTFTAAYREAEIEATETMEAEAHRRGVDGVDKPVYQGGAMVGTVREYSDTLLIFMLKARNPEKYRERVDVTNGSLKSEVERIAVKYGKTPEEVVRDAGLMAKAL